MSRVAIVRGNNPQKITVEALTMVEAQRVLSKDKRILIKPNYINASHPSTGITTDCRVIEGVIQFLKQQGLNNIVVGEGGGLSDTFRAFRSAGVDAVAERWNVELMDLNKDEFITVHPKNPLALTKVKIARIALESSIISVPKLKLHRTTSVTLSLKNMMGAMTPKGSMHSGSLSKNIVDLASIVKPSLAVVDGIIAGEGHETSRDPVEMNIVLAGIDPVAVDAVGASVMGVNPESVRHLRFAEEKGLGTWNLSQIEVSGEPIEKIRKKFRSNP